MDMGFETGHFGPEQAAQQDSGAPEWLAMRARLGTQWMARRALVGAGGGSEAATGSFNSPAACALTAYKASTPSVNPTALGNGKPIGAIGDDTASAQPTDGRG